MSPKTDAPRCELDEVVSSGFPAGKVFCVRGFVTAKRFGRFGIGCSITLMDKRNIVMTGFFDKVVSVHDVTTETRLSGTEIEIGYYPEGWLENYQMDCEIETEFGKRILYIGILPSTM